MTQVIPLPNGTDLEFEDDTPTSVMEHILKQHLMGDKQGPYAPNAKEAMQSRASTGIEGYMGDINDPTNAQAAAFTEGLSLGGTKPAYGAYNAAKEAMRGNSATEGYNAGIEAYNKGMAQRDEKGGWGSTGARVAGSVPSYVAATLAGANPTLLNFLSGAAYNSDDPQSAAAGGMESAAIGKATEWGAGKLGSKLFGEGPQPAGPPLEVNAPKPNILRQGGATVLRGGADVLDSDLAKFGTLSHAAEGIFSGDLGNSLTSGAIAAARPHLVNLVRAGANKLEGPTVEGAKKLIYPALHASAGPTRAELAKALAMGTVSPFGSRDVPPQAAALGDW